MQEEKVICVRELNQKNDKKLHIFKKEKVLSESMCWCLEFCVKLIKFPYL